MAKTPPTHEPRWGCNHCPERFEELGQAFRHTNDVHSINPLDTSRRSA
jgi:hypothetical protein